MLQNVRIRRALSLDPMGIWHIETNEKVKEVDASFGFVFVSLLDGRLLWKSLLDDDGQFESMKDEHLKVIHMESHIDYCLIALVEHAVSSKQYIYYYDESKEEMIELYDFNDFQKRISWIVFEKFRVDCLHGLVLDEENNLYSLSINGNIIERKPISIESCGIVSKIYSGAYHFVILDEKGYVYTMGNNSYCQCGITTVVNNDQLDFPKSVTIPQCIDILKDSVRIIKAGCGASHTLLLSDDGCVYAIGSNSEGQCGQSNEYKQLLNPTLVESDSNNATIGDVIDIACGSSASFLTSANDDSGEIMFYGCGSFQQMNSFGYLEEKRQYGFSLLSEMKSKHSMVYCSSISNNAFLLQ